MGFERHLLALSLIAAPVGSAWAAPPTDSGPETGENGAEELDELDEEAQAAKELAEARLTVGRDMFKQGQEAWEAGDYQGAIDSWEQVLTLMPEQRATIRVNLAHAHVEAYAADQVLRHLQQAQSLFSEHLQSLDADDPSRGEIEAQLDAIEAEFDAIATAEAEAQAKLEEDIRAEEARAREQALAEAELDHQRSVNKIYFGLGGSLAAAGVGTLAGMAYFMVQGANATQEGFDRAQRQGKGSMGSQESDYEALIARGQALDRGAVITGVVGGLLVAGGTALLVVAGVRNKKLGRSEARSAKIAWTPGLGSLALHF